MQTLTTERLRLRPARRDDAPFMFELLNSPGFLANIGDRNVRSAEDAVGYIETAAVFDGSRGLGFNVVEELATGEVVGICGLVKREALDDVDVGYAFLERAWGRGYAQEAAAATLAHARGPLGLERIVAITAPANAGSRRVLERIGMRYEGMVEVPGYDGGSCLYAVP
jgi:[ribosomal protein S5]-alanine N-acetyltransferase